MSNEHDDETTPDEDGMTADERLASEREELEALGGSVDGDGGAPAASEDDLDNTSFALLAVALLVLVGGSVFFVGKLLNSQNETAQAQSQAEGIIAGFESDLPTTVPILPFDDDASFETFPDPSTSSTTTTTRAPRTTTTVVQPTVDPSQIALAFVNRVPGDDYAKVGYIDPEGERHITELECDRLDLNENRGICLSATAGLAGTGRGFILDANLNPTTRFGVNKPSRAAASPDGTVVAWTGFSLGHSYLVQGEFATTTQLISVDRSIAANVETIFDTFRGDERVLDIDRNYWGVSFFDSDLFYATLGTANSGTEIVAGRVSTTRIDVVASNASCPEVSPDGKTIVAKEQRGDKFQLIAIDLESGARRDLGETRSVDDQVEWIDNQTILYGMPNPDEGTEAQPVFDIYALNTAPGSAPRLIVPFADSPAA